MARKPTLTSEQIIELSQMANKGNQEAYRTLMNYNYTASKKANARLLALERADRDVYAYDRAITYVSSEYGRNRFPTAKHYFESDVRQLRDQLLNINRFLESKTSTISGQKSLEKSKADAFRAKGINIPKGQERRFLEFLGSDAFEELMAFNTNSSEAINDLAQILSDEEVTIDKLQREFDRYISREIDILELRENLGVPLI